MTTIESDKRLLVDYNAFYNFSIQTSISFLCDSLLSFLFR